MREAGGELFIGGATVNPTLGLAACNSRRSYQDLFSKLFSKMENNKLTSSFELPQPSAQMPMDPKAADGDVANLAHNAHGLAHHTH